MPKILAIDDKVDNLITINAVLKNLMPECEVTTALSGAEGIEKIKNEEPDTILLDIQMPKMDGFEVCKKLKTDKNFKHIPIILVTATQKSSPNRIKGLKLGADAFISKPIEEGELVAQINVALRIKKYTDLLRGDKERLEKAVEEKTKHLKESYGRLEILFNGIIQTLVAVIEMRDPYTAGHQERVDKLACKIAKEMKLPQTQIDGLHIAAILHDVGKMNVPAEILSKPGMLTDIEFTMLKSHSQFGYDILKKIDFPWPVAKIVIQHHEKINGSGYPNGLKNEEMMIEAKILGVADVVEAIMSHRPYRESLGVNTALKEIIDNRGILYDTKVVDTCLKLFIEERFSFTETSPEKIDKNILHKK